MNQLETHGNDERVIGEKQADAQRKTDERCVENLCAAAAR